MIVIVDMDTLRVLCTFRGRWNARILAAVLRRLRIEFPAADWLGW